MRVHLPRLGYQKMRKIILLAIKFTISAALLYYALRKVDFPGLWSRLNRDSLGWIAISIVLLLIQIYCAALRWREISAQCGAPLSSRQTLRFNMIGAFFNQTLPSSIGGDAVRLLLVSRIGFGWRAAAYSVFVDRAIGLIALALMVTLSLPWSFQLISDPHGRAAVTLIALTAVAAGLGFLACGLLEWPKLKHWRPIHHILACSVIANRVLFDRSIGLRVGVLSFMIHFFTVATVWCGARSIHAPVNLSEIFLLIPTVSLVTMVPISIAGWGVRETAMMVGFGYAGLSQNDGVNVSLLFGLATFFVGAIGGFIWIFSSGEEVKMASLIK